MSLAARAFAAQQDRRHRRLLIGPLLLESRSAEQDLREGTRQTDKQRAKKGREGGDAEEQRQSPGASTHNQPAEPSATSAAAGKCPSQQRALATLRRLHPTATLLSGVGGAGASPNRKAGAGPLFAGPGLSRRWRKPLPWPALAGASRQDGSVAAAGSGLGRSVKQADEPYCPPSFGDALRRGLGKQSCSKAGSSAPPPPQQQPPSFSNRQPASSPPTAVAATAATASPPPVGSQQRDGRTPLALVATLEATSKECDELLDKLTQMSWAVVLLEPLIYGEHHSMYALSSDHELAMNAFGHVEACRTALAAEAASMAMQLRQQAQQAGLGGGASAAGGGAPAGGSTQLTQRERQQVYSAISSPIVARLEERAEADRRRLEEQCQKHGWSDIYGAVEALASYSVQQLSALLQQLRPGPGPLRLTTAAPTAAAPEALAWKQLVLLADRQQRLGETAGRMEGMEGAEDEYDSVEVLRSAVLGLVLLEGCTGAEAGPVGLLGPPDPLACAMLFPTIDVLASMAAIEELTAKAEGLRGGEHRFEFARYCTPALVYELLAHAPLAAAESEELPASSSSAPEPHTTAGMRAMQRRYSDYHLNDLIDCMQESPLQYLLRTSLIIAAKAGLGEAAIKRAARDLLVLYPEEYMQGGAACTTAHGPAAGGGPWSPSGGGDGGSTEDGLEPYIYDCLYMPATEWDLIYPEDDVLGRPPPRMPYVGRSVFAVSHLEQLQLLDVMYDSTAVRQLHGVLGNADVFAQRMRAGWADRSAAEQAVQVAAKDAVSRVVHRRRANAMVQSRWEVRNPGEAARLRALAAAADARQLTAAAVAEAVHGVRPGLLEVEVHRSTWGGLLAWLRNTQEQLAEGRDDPVGRRHAAECAVRVHELTRLALHGLLALAGQNLPLPQLRLGFCVATGAFLMSPTNRASREVAVGSAVELFRFLSTVPCPLLVTPEPDWTLSAAAIAPAQLAAMSSVPRADPGRQAFMASLLNHSVERYDMVPELAATLTDCIEATAAADAAEAAATEAARGEAAALRKLAAEAVKRVAVLALWESECSRPYGDSSGGEFEAEGQGGLGGAGGSGGGARGLATAADSVKCEGSKSRDNGRGTSSGSGGASRGDSGGVSSGGGGSAAVARPVSAASPAFMGPNTKPVQAAAALQHLVGCHRWLLPDPKQDAALAAALKALPPPAPTSLMIAGSDQMLLAMLFLRNARRDIADHTYLVFEPMASEDMARGALRRGPQEKVELFPPPPGEPGVLLLSGVQMALLPHSKLSEYAQRFEWNRIYGYTDKLIVTGKSRWSGQLKLAETIMVEKRLGAVWITGEGREGVQRALLLAAKVRKQLSDKHGTSLYVAAVDVRWPKDDCRGRPGSPGSGDDDDGGGSDSFGSDSNASRLLGRLGNIVLLGQESREYAQAMGRPSRRKPQAPELAALAAFLVQQMPLALQCAVPGGGCVRDKVRVELRLMECERGRPDRPRLPLSGKESAKQLLKAALLMR